MAYGVNTDAMVANIIAGASNVKSSAGNPAYTKEDFSIYFPQFSNITTIPEEIYALYMEMANASLSQGRWKSKWKYAMALYIAHFLTLWQRTQVSEDASAAQVVAGAQNLLVASSKSVDGVSVSYDVSSIQGSLPGWGMWTTTTFGTQLAQLANFLPTARAGMYVY